MSSRRCDSGRWAAAPPGYAGARTGNMEKGDRKTSKVLQCPLKKPRGLTQPQGGGRVAAAMRWSMTAWDLRRTFPVDRKTRRLGIDRKWLAQELPFTASRRGRLRRAHKIERMRRRERICKGPTTAAGSAPPRQTVDLLGRQSHGGFLDRRHRRQRAPAHAARGYAPTSVTEYPPEPGSGSDSRVGRFVTGLFLVAPPASGLRLRGLSALLRQQPRRSA